MKSITASVILTLLAAIAHTAPTPDSEPCNPNAHGRQCGAILHGAAGVTENVNVEANTGLTPIYVDLSISKIENPDNGQFEYWTFFGVDGSVTKVAPGQTTDVGPPQVQTSAFCDIQCPY